MAITAVPIRKALTTNSTVADFAAALTPTTTEPVDSEDNGIYDLTDAHNGVGFDGRVPERILLIPYGGNASNDIFNMRLWGWSKTVGAPGTAIWVPQLLVDLACTLGNNDWSALGANMKAADTLVVTDGLADERTLGVSIMSPEGEMPATAIVHLRGCEKIQFHFDMDTGGDSGNCLWRTLDCT